MTRVRAVVLGIGTLILACSMPAGDVSDLVQRDPTAPVGAAVLGAPRIWYSPYDSVDWTTTLRLKAQTHDHTGITDARLLGYDSAGYAFVPVMDYSGVASLPYTRKRRLWPADSVVAPRTRNAMRNLRAWVPAAEEVGYQHLVSLFLTQYIAKWEPDQYASREPWMYGSTQEAITAIEARGGFAILAHPWGPWEQFAGLSGYEGMEVYSAFAEQRFLNQASATSDDRFFAARNRNTDLMQAWDRVLGTGRFVVGVAVNDHHGPYPNSTPTDPRVRDSGKILVLTDTASLEGLARAMRRGSILAVADRGVPKDQIPRLDSLRIEGSVIHLHTDASVRWFANGRMLDAFSDSLDVATLPVATRYVRAELRGADGSVVFLQPILLRARGDVNGDFSVDSEDDRICREAAAAGDAPPRLRAACADRPTPRDS